MLFVGTAIDENLNNINPIYEPIVHNGFTFFCEFVDFKDTTTLK